MIDNFNLDYIQGQKTAYEDMKGLNNVLWRARFFDTVAKQRIDDYANMRIKQLDKMADLALKMLEEERGDI